MGKALKIRDELSAEALRRAARREKDGRAAARMYAIAHALDGMSRAEAARLAGMERQALRDAVAPQRDPASEVVKAELRAHTEVAIERGVFGVQTVAPSSISAWLKSPGRCGSTSASARASSPDGVGEGTSSRRLAPTPHRRAESAAASARQSPKVPASR